MIFSLIWCGRTWNRERTDFLGSCFGAKKMKRGWIIVSMTIKIILLLRTYRVYFVLFIFPLQAV